MSCAVESPIALRGRGKRRALAEDQERQVVTMYTQSQVPVAQIAAAFGVCRKTVYNILTRATQNMKAPPGEAGRG